MSKRKSTISGALISQLPNQIITKMLNYKIPKKELEKFEKEEKKEAIENIEDLIELPNHSEFDIYFALNHIAESQQ